MAWHVRLLSAGATLPGVGRSQAAVVASEGYGFSALDEVHPSSSLGRRPGLGFRRTTFVDSDTTGLEEAQRHDVQDVDLYALFLVGLGTMFERAATSVSFDRLSHVLHLVSQLFRAAPLVEAVVASDV